MTPADFSVIICTHSDARWQYLGQAVRSVQGQDLVPREIIVVVDHNPALRDRIQREFPNVRAVENREPRGASGAKNTGVAVAVGKFVAFLDDDAVADPDWLERLMQGLNRAEVLGVGGMTKPLWPDRRPRWFPREFDWVVGCTHRGTPGTGAPVRNLIACNMIVRREVFEAFGGFRDGIGPNAGRALGCEETEFCIRVNQRSPRKIWLQQLEAKVYHQVPATRTTWRYFMRRCYGEGISKALIADLVGTRAGLASERQYVARTLPLGVLRGMSDLLLRFDLGGLGRATAIVLGLTATTFGYVKGRLLSANLANPANVFGTRPPQKTAGSWIRFAASLTTNKHARKRS